MSAQVPLRTAVVAAATEPTVLCPDRIPRTVSRAQPVVAQSLSDEFRCVRPSWAPPVGAETDPPECGTRIGEVTAVQSNGRRSHGSRISQIRFNHGKTVQNPYSRSVSIACLHGCHHVEPSFGEVSPERAVGDG